MLGNCYSLVNDCNWVTEKNKYWFVLQTVKPCSKALLTLLMKISMFLDFLQNVWFCACLFSLFFVFFFPNNTPHRVVMGWHLPDIQTRLPPPSNPWKTFVKGSLAKKVKSQLIGKPMHSLSIQRHNQVSLSNNFTWDILLWLLKDEFRLLKQQSSLTIYFLWS